MSFGQKNQSQQISSIFSHYALNPFNTSHRAKIGAKMAKQGVDVLMSNHNHVVMSLEPVQLPMFACYTLGLPNNLSSVPQLPPGGCSRHSKDIQDILQNGKFFCGNEGVLLPCDPH